MCTFPATKKHSNRKQYMVRSPFPRPLCFVIMSMLLHDAVVALVQVLVSVT